MINFPHYKKRILKELHIIRSPQKCQYTVVNSTKDMTILRISYSYKDEIVQS